eukprot:scaffold294725_cov16-Prasinocladus_malaysianus.AAC.1
MRAFIDASNCQAAIGFIIHYGSRRLFGMVSERSKQGGKQARQLTSSSSWSTSTASFTTPIHESPDYESPEWPPLGPPSRDPARTAAASRVQTPDR